MTDPLPPIDASALDPSLVFGGHAVDVHGLLFALGNDAGDAVAAVLVELNVDLVQLDRHADPAVSHMPAVLAAAGLTRTYTLDPHTAPTPITWTVRVPRPGRPAERTGVYHRTPHTSWTVITPLPPVPPGWLDVATTTHRCAVYVTTHTVMITRDWRPDGFFAQLRQAAADGLVYATTAAIT